MLDARTRNRNATRLRPVRAPGLPVEAMVLGKPVRDAADLLPRLFNLCRAAQALAVHRALGLLVSDDLKDELRREILRDHLLKLSVSLPAQFGAGPRALPPDWATDPISVALALFGAPAAPPATAEDFESFLTGGTATGALLNQIDQCFAKGEAATGILEPFTRSAPNDVSPAENSVAGRHSLQPVMRHIAETRGRGPLWRATARIYDIAASLNDRLPVAVTDDAGRIFVPATRGAYAVSAQSENGVVTAFARITPTDHLLVADGILDRTLATLPAEKEGLAPLILEILDPCSPLRLKEPGHA
ncbi:MAG: hydrogenase expression/formation protein HupK [Rhodobacteraceae bacterium]|nr:hydrogenase expression/formation protein HupK [Paracoccaceae bacterium]